MTLHSTPEWRNQFRQFLNRRRDWTYIHWAQVINTCPVLGNCYLTMSEFTLARWVNSHAGKREYAGPKSRQDYVGIAHALIQLEVISQAEACQWLLVQGLYPLPNESDIFGQSLQKIRNRNELGGDILVLPSRK